MTEPDAGEALRPILDAFRRGTKRSRLRLCAVVCPAGHTLLEVFPTSSGPVALWSELKRWAPGPDGTSTVRDRSSSWVATFLDSEERANPSCRCTEDTAVDMEWVQQQVTEGRRRVVAP